MASSTTTEARTRPPAARVETPGAPKSVKTRTVTLAICFYKDIATLERTLDSVVAQWRKPDEIVIADDGSDPAIADRIALWSNSHETEIIHAWHPNTGFRQSEMRNKAALVATSEHVVYIDHDCLLTPTFIRGHLATANGMRMQQGPRINVMPPASLTFRPALIPTLRAFASKRLFGWREAVRGGEILERTPEVICGCNLLVPRRIITAVNGFDENFRSWGYEDAEFVVRAWSAGFGMSLSGAGTTVFHIHHPSRANDDNRARFEASIRARLTRCENGISRHSLRDVTRTRQGCYTRVEFPD